MASAVGPLMLTLAQMTTHSINNKARTFMKLGLFVASVLASTGCGQEGPPAAGQPDNRPRNVVIALTIDNKMEKDVQSAKCEFIPAQDYYLEGYIAAKRGTASNLGVRVVQRPTSIRFTYYVAKDGAANQGAIVAGEPMPSGVPAADQRVSVTADVPLVEPKSNEANIPEYHLEIQSDGTVRQIDLPKK